jgi:hypothetical protein
MGCDVQFGPEKPTRAGSSCDSLALVALRRFIASQMPEMTPDSLKDTDFDHLSIFSDQMLNFEFAGRRVGQVEMSVRLAIPP